MVFNYCFENSTNLPIGDIIILMIFAPYPGRDGISSVRIDVVLKCDMELSMLNESYFVCGNRNYVIFLNKIYAPKDKI